MTGRADIEAANPRTGEVLEHLDQQPPEKLAEAYAEIVARQAELARWGDALNGELRRRLKLVKRSLHVWGDWEVEAKQVRESEWDVEELRGVIDDLVSEGVIQKRETTDLFVTPQPYVARARARELAARLSGDAKAAVQACCTWKDKSTKLTVVRSVQLLDAAGSPAAEETPPVGGHADRDGSAPEAAPAPAGSSESPRAARAPSSPDSTSATRQAGPAQPSPTLDPEELFA
jgi:hypothetical protein